MAENPEDDFLASSAPVPAPRPTDPDAEYAYGIPDVQEMGIGTQFFNMFVPYRSRVVEPSTTEYIPLEELGMDSIRGEVMRKFTPGEYAEPEFGFSYMPAVQGIASFFANPVESAKAAGEAIMDLPKQQMLGAEAMMQGYDFGYDPETGQEYRYDPTLVPATTAAGTMISIAREGPGGQILGIMAGRNAHDGDRKFQQFTEAKDKGLDDREVYAETKGYIEPSDNAFRFEIDTSNAKLNKEYFKDSEIEDVADGAPYQRFQFEEFTKKEGRPPTLGDLMEFKELYYQYPELSDIEIKRVPFGMFNTKAAYDPIDNVIYISSAGPRQMVSDLLHEVQHAVQHVEGHVTGSGVRQYLPEGFDERRKIQSDQVNRSAAFYADKLEKQAKKKGIDANLYKYNMARKAKLYFDGDSSAYGYEDLSQYATVADLQDLRILADDFEKLEAMDAEVIKAGKMYFRQPGEVEARTAQTKYIEDRQGEFPLDVQDVAPEDYFYRIDSKPGVMESSATPQDFEFYQDNPAVSRPDSGKEWLESNIRFTEERYADTEPSMLRGPITANLGSRNTDMFLSTDELTQLPGAMGETRGPGDPNFDRLLEQIKTEGFDPDQAGNKVVVGVNHKGEAYLMEGNTRAAVAKELGIPNIKTEVRYWNGGEMVDGPFKPEAVAARASGAPRPTAPTSGALSDLSTPELITSWVIEPSKVDRAEVASRLLSQPDVVARSNQALDTMGYGDTIPMFRLVKLTNDGDLQPEGLISATLDPNKVPSNIKFLTEGKFGMTTPTDYRLVRYDVPREKIAGYLPAVSDDIKRTVNRAVKEKGFGQDNVPGMTTVTNPAKYAKELIDLQDEIIADVSGLKPTVLVDDSGRPMNMLSMGGALPKLIAEGRVTTPEDISEILPNYFALNPMEYARQGNDIPFEVAEKQAREALISRYQDFFGIQNKAEGGVITLADVARNMNRGPRGVGSLAPVARNMYRTMVS